MRSAFFLLPGILPALSACGRGGATLETDNVQAEWFPNGSRTAIVLEGESEPVSEREIRHPHSGMTLFTIRWGRQRNFGNRRRGSGNGYSNMQPGSGFRGAAFQNGLPGNTSE
ncbi:hypothetical protein M5E88_04545 [Akkermansia muciniphila]|nr:hypothetical protein M5E88_04545 [Akkermansia muciniphila]